MALNANKLDRLVRIWDPAIDRERSEIDRYIDTRDMKYLRFLEGQEPRVFVLRNPGSTIVMEYLMSAQHEGQRYNRAFRASCVAIERFEGEDGIVRPSWSPEATREADGRQRDVHAVFDLWNAREIEQLEAAEIAEIGHWCWERCFLPRGIVARYSLPRTSLQILALITLQSVERARSLAGPGKPE